MEIKRGQVVRSLCGRDQGCFLTVIGQEGPCLLLADGGRRPLERPKRKKPFHVAATAAVLEAEALQTNRQIRTALRLFSQRAGKT